MPDRNTAFSGAPCAAAAGSQPSPRFRKDWREPPRGVSGPPLRCRWRPCGRWPTSGPSHAPEIHAVRRVEAPGDAWRAAERKLIAPAGHKNDGHVLLHKTTRQFPIDFGLKNLKELPTLEEFAELRERYERNLSSPTGVPPG